jgi:formylglycine-generating enzyme
MNRKRSMKALVVLAAVALIAALLALGQLGATARAQEATPTPEPAPGATRVRETDGAVMVYVPAGEFLMGSPEGAGWSDEHPQHNVTLDAFWIDRTEVTNHQFELFTQATGYRTEAEAEGESGVWAREIRDFRAVNGADWRHPAGPDTSIEGRTDVPVVQISWNDAQAYCAWAGARLPTEAEWQKAACGSDGQRYPWGNDTPGCRYSVMADEGGEGCGVGGPSPVGSKPEGASPYGALDMAGNVREAVADWYSAGYYAESPAVNPQGPDGPAIYRVTRGGSWVSEPGQGMTDHMRCAQRGQAGPSDRADVLGFRCAVSASALAAPAVAAAPGPPASVLFIGDSLSYLLSEYFPKLTASGDPPITIEAAEAVEFGSSLCLDWSGNLGVDAIRSGKWDVVVLEEDLGDRWPAVETYGQCAQKYDEEIKQAGGETILYMPWKDRDVLTPTNDDIAVLCDKSGRELGATVAPVGLAFERSRQERPELDLYADDGDHPSPFGSYLMQCVLYATLFERSPEGLTYRMGDIAPDSELGQFWAIKAGWAISDDEAAFLQRIAWETVLDFETEQPARE